MGRYIKKRQFTIKDILTREYIEQNYLSKDKTIKEICSELNITETSFYKQMKLLKIETLGYNQAKRKHGNKLLAETKFQELINRFPKELLERWYCIEWKSQNTIAEENNISKHDINRLFRYYKLTHNKQIKDFDVVGLKFGKLKVLETPFQTKGKRVPRCKCLCDCGRTVTVSLTPLRDGKIISCGCFVIGEPKINGIDYKGNSIIPKGFLSRYRSHAKRRKKEFSVSVEYLSELFEKQNGRCAFTGELLTFNHYGYKFGDNNVSLDRINSSIGYVEGNVQWVSKKVNLAKQALSDEQFIELCKDVVKYAEQKEANSVGR